MSNVTDVSILCIDDEEPNLHLFELVFKKKYQVHTATSAAEGMEKLRDPSRNIVAVFTDMWMPTMSGLDFIKKAKEEYGLVWYFILSSYYVSDEIKEAMDQKIVNGFFQKPFNTDEIENCIEDLVNSISVSNN
ncbi:MAG: response regulator [Cyclobacteriaceae bacterium]